MTKSMTDPMMETGEGDVWPRLAAPFPRESVAWQVVRLSEDGQRAQVRPQLYLEAVLMRLNAVVGVAGWSNLYTPSGEAIICALTVHGITPHGVTRHGVTKDGVTKSAVSAEPLLNVAERAQDALVRAAEHFLLTPPVEQRAIYWVDYNPEAAEILYEPEPVVAADGGVPPAALATAPNAPVASAVATGAPEATKKTEGQMAIDRLVERLQSQGMGLDAAKLVSLFGGYGGNPEQARELYRQLRDLLKSADAR
jgi:hypothetical protein